MGKFASPNCISSKVACAKARASGTATWASERTLITIRLPLPIPRARFCAFSLSVMGWDEIDAMKIDTEDYEKTPLLRRAASGARYAGELRTVLCDRAGAKQRAPVASRCAVIDGEQWQHQEREHDLQQNRDKDELHRHHKPVQSHRCSSDRSRSYRKLDGPSRLLTCRSL